MSDLTLDPDTIQDMQDFYERAAKRGLSLEAFGRALVGGVAAIYKANDITVEQACEAAVVTTMLVYNEQST